MHCTAIEHPCGFNPRWAAGHVDVVITANEVVLRLRGLHKFWAFKHEVRIPLTQLKLVEQGVDPEARAMLSGSLRRP